MSDSDRIAVAAHLHVLLRRKTGRVTDTEWMAANAEYAQAIVRFARERAASDAAPELEEWAARLEDAWERALAEPAPRAPLLAAAAHAVRERLVPATPMAQAAATAIGAGAGPGAGGRYVGGIR